MLPGSLKAVAQVLFAPEQARQAMAERKTEVFGQFATLHPEALFVFIGDSGEGDVDFAEEFMAVEWAERAGGCGGLPARRAALIHDVVRCGILKRIFFAFFRIRARCPFIFLLCLPLSLSQVRWCCAEKL